MKVDVLLVRFPSVARTRALTDLAKRESTIVAFNKNAPNN